MMDLMMDTTASSDDPQAGRQSIRRGKLNLVDLAGSERQSKTGKCLISNCGYNFESRLLFYRSDW